MTTDNFTEAARAEAEERYEFVSDMACFEEGVEWARAHLAAQDPTDEGRRVTYFEVEAYLAAFSEDLPPDTEWTPDTIARVRRGLTAAYAARRDEEKR